MEKVVSHKENHTARNIGILLGAVGGLTAKVIWTRSSRRNEDTGRSSPQDGVVPGKIYAAEGASIGTETSGGSLREDDPDWGKPTDGPKYEAGL